MRVGRIFILGFSLGPPSLTLGVQNPCGGLSNAGSFTAFRTRGTAHSYNFV
jgi:hypothetical protein